MCFTVFDMMGSGPRAENIPAFWTKSPAISQELSKLASVHLSSLPLPSTLHMPSPVPPLLAQYQVIACPPWSLHRLFPPLGVPPSPTCHSLALSSLFYRSQPPLTHSLSLGHPVLRNISQRRQKQKLPMQFIIKLNVQDV